MAKSRKATTLLILAVVLVIAGYFIYSQQPGKKEYSFDEGLSLLDKAWLDNSIDFYSSLDNGTLVSLPDSAFDKIKSKAIALKADFKSQALKDMADIYASFAEQYKLAKEISVDSADFDALENQEKCSSLEKADIVYDKSQLLVTKIKYNNLLISDFAEKHKAEYDKTKLSQKLLSGGAIKGFTANLFNIQTEVAKEKAACE